MGRHGKKLTAAFVRSVRQPGLYWDEHGLVLRVKPSGYKQWIQRLFVHGKRRELGLGPVRLVTLAEARDAALANRKVARAGGDPRTKRQQFSADVRAGGGQGLRHAPSDLDRQARGPVDGDATHVRVSGGRAEAGGPDFIGRCDERVASDLEREAPDGQAGPSTDFDGDEVGDRAGLPRGQPGGRCDRGGVAETPSHPEALQGAALREVAAAVEAVRRAEARVAVKLGIEFLVLTACRSGEVRGTRWEEIDMEAGEWTIPAERMKSRREHRVPLSARAREILAEAKAYAPRSEWVFPSARGLVLSSFEFAGLLKALGIATVPHGFRSSFRDWAAERTDAPHAVMEAALAHVVRNRVEAAYARSDLFERRRVLMKQWAEYLAGRRASTEA